MALTRRSMPSPNYSSRSGATLRILVVHTAEGARTIEELGNYFASSSSGVSSHTGADDKLGVIGEYVNQPASKKAWTQGNANAAAAGSIELCAFAAWDAAEWARHPNMLSNCAQWLAEEAARFSLPLTKLTPAQAQGSGRGVCQHADLGSWGGGHWDCGSYFPIDDVLEMARGGGEVASLPQWFWEWSSWYLTTDRDADARPAGTPATIPEWAWDELDEVQKIGKRYGMTNPERDWISWYLGGRDPNERPDVPSTIPDRWWDDESYVLAREHTTLGR